MTTQPGDSGDQARASHRRRQHQRDLHAAHHARGRAARHGRHPPHLRPVQERQDEVVDEAHRRLRPDGGERHAAHPRQERHRHEARHRGDGHAERPPARRHLHRLQRRRLHAAGRAHPRQRAHRLRLRRQEGADAATRTSSTASTNATRCWPRRRRKRKRRKRQKAGARAEARIGHTEAPLHSAIGRRRTAQGSAGACEGMPGQRHAGPEGGCLSQIREGGDSGSAGDGCNRRSHERRWTMLTCGPSATSSPAPSPDSPPRPTAYKTITDLVGSLPGVQLTKQGSDTFVVWKPT